MIKKLLCVLALAALATALMPAAVSAQDETPGGANKLRFFGGFSYLRFTAAGNDEVPMLRQNTYGLQGNMVYYLHPKVGVMFDAALNTGNILPDLAPDGVDSADLSFTSWLFGPSFVMSNNGQVLVQAYVTVGAAAASIDLRGTNEAALPVFQRFDKTVFAGSIGANFDVTINPSWGIRIAQLEVLIMSFDETLTNFRYSGGIVGTF